MGQCSIFVENMSSAAAGSLLRNPLDEGAYEAARRLGQGNAARYFRSLGSVVERDGGAAAAEQAMNGLALMMALIARVRLHHPSLSDDQHDDLVHFLAERMRHNVERLFRD